MEPWTLSLSFAAGLAGGGVCGGETTAFEGGRTDPGFAGAPWFDEGKTDFEPGSSCFGVAAGFADVPCFDGGTPWRDGGGGTPSREPGRPCFEPGLGSVPIS